MPLVPDIRYICLSDLHLGADTSVLTNLDRDGRPDPDPAPMLEKMLRGLGDLLRENQPATPPTLVLHGDLFELALTTVEVAAATFSHLVIEAWGDPEHPLFAYEVLYVPGNHDHHMWEIAREQLYEDNLDEGAGWNQVMQHVTKMSPAQAGGAGHEPIVGQFARRALGVDRDIPSPTFHVIYPNLALVDETGDRAVVITHGHYLEPMYRAMTYLLNVIAPERPPRLRMASLEADNWAWIDFFWSTMGRSGEGSPEDDELIPELYELLKDEQAISLVFDQLIDEFVPSKRSLVRGLQRRVLRRAGRHVSGRITSRERHHAAVLSPEATSGLTNYLEGPVHGQLLDEFERVPKRLDFVFGHTHKPFAARHQAAGYPGPIVAHNSGGWVVDAVDPEPKKGASIVLISADLEVVDLCVYQQEADPSRYRVGVIPVNDPPEEPTPLRDWLIETIDPDTEPWSGIARQAAETVRARQDQMRRRIEQGRVPVRAEPPLAPRGW